MASTFGCDVRCGLGLTGGAQRRSTPPAQATLSCGEPLCTTHERCYEGRCVDNVARDAAPDAGADEVP